MNTREFRSCRVFPLELSGQSLARPKAEGLSVEQTDVHDRVVGHVGDGTSAAYRLEYEILEKQFRKGRRFSDCYLRVKACPGAIV